jgi:hypothetical protein
VLFAPGSVPLGGNAKSDGHAGQTEPQVGVVGGAEEADVVAHDDDDPRAEQGEEEDPYPRFRPFWFRFGRRLAPNSLRTTLRHTFAIVVVAGLKMGL